MYSAFGVDHGDIEKGLGSFVRGLGRGAKATGSSPIHANLAAGGKAQKLNIPSGGSIFDQMVAERGAPGAAMPKKAAGKFKPMLAQGRAKVSGAIAGGKARVAGGVAGAKARVAPTGGAHRGYRTYGIKPAGGKHRA